MDRVEKDGCNLRSYDGFYSRPHQDQLGAKAGASVMKNELLYGNSILANAQAAEDGFRRAIGNGLCK